MSWHIGHGEFSHSSNLMAHNQLLSQIPYLPCFGQLPIGDLCQDLDTTFKEGWGQTGACRPKGYEDANGSLK